MHARDATNGAMRIAILLACCTVALAGCSSPTTPAPADAGNDAAPLADGGSDAASADGGGDASLPLDAQPGDSGADAASPAMLTITGDGDFGTWRCGEALASRAVTIRNIGGSRGGYLTSLQGRDAAWVRVAGRAAGVLDPGESTVLTLSIEQPPGAEWRFGGVTAEVDLLPTAPAVLEGSPRVVVSAGLGGTTARLTGTYGDFGDRALGSSTTATLRIINDGTTDVSFDVSSNVDPAFTFSLPGLSGGRVTVPFGTELSGTVTYAPTAAGEQRGQIVFRHTAPTCDAGPLVQNLVGHAVTGDLRVGPDVELGEVGCNTLGPSGTLTVSNAGAGPLSVTASLVLGPDSAFTLSPTSFSLSPGSSRDITVTPSRTASALPSVPVARGDTIIVTGGSVERHVEVRQQTGGAALRWQSDAPTTLTPVAPVAQYVLTNEGTQATDVSFAVDPAFTVSPTTVRMDPGSVQVVTVTTSSSTSAATLLVASADACSVPTSAPSIAYRPPAPGELLAPGRVDLPSVGCGVAFGTVAMPITNTSTSAREVVTVAEGGFSLTLDGAPLPSSFTMGPGETWFVDVGYEETNLGSLVAHEGMLTMASGEDVIRVELSARRSDALVLAYGENLHEVPVGVTVEHVLTLYNAGNAEGTVTYENGSTGLVGTVTVPPLTTVRVPMPRTVPVGLYMDAVSFVSDGCAPIHDVTLQGLGVADAWGLGVSEISFDPVPCHGAPPAPRSVYLYNAGPGAIPFDAAVAGAGFSVTPTTGTVASRSSVELTVYVRPVGDAIPGPIGATLVVDAGSSQETVALSSSVDGVYVVREADTVDFGAVLADGRSTLYGSLGYGAISADTSRIQFDLAGARMPGELWLVQESAPFAVAAYFHPLALGPRSFTITPRAVAGTPLCAPLPGPVTLTATGVGTAELVVAPSVVTFDPTDCGSTPGSAAFLVHNTGAGAAGFTVNLEPGSWLVATPASGTVPLGQTRQVTLTSRAIPRDAHPSAAEVRGGYHGEHRETVQITGPSEIYEIEVVVPSRGAAFAPIHFVTSAPFMGGISLSGFRAQVSEPGAFTFTPGAWNCLGPPSTTESSEDVSIVGVLCTAATTVSVSTTRTDACTPVGLLTAPIP